MSHFTTRSKHILCGLVLAALAGWLTGCQEPSKSSSWSSGRVPVGMLSVSDLAARLGLSVAKAGSPYYELKNANNRVLLFMHDNGRVFVNGQPVGQVGRTYYANGAYYVSESLIAQIRPHLKTAPAWTPSPKPKPRPGTAVVVIDPGHGGKDPGAVSYLGNYEKDITLAIARKLAAILQRRGVQVVMTRQGDTFVELNDRADIANNAGADLFVSIHGDSMEDRTHRGFTVYIARSASEASRRLGRSIENALSRTGIPSKGLRTADYRVLVRTNCPAVLVECGYLSNPQEAALLMDGAYQDRIAAAIADGILAEL